MSYLDCFSGRSGTVLPTGARKPGSLPAERNRLRRLRTEGRIVAVTGSTGRLGRAVLQELRHRGWTVRGWSRPDYDLEDPFAAARLVERDQPSVVIHSAAWTDVEGCARNPDRAARMNGRATGELASACASNGVDLLYVSTNEVFDGARTDRVGYRPWDAPNPASPYGASKLLGERLSAAAFQGGKASLWIVRTAWLYGPPGEDFPSKILRAANQLEPGKALAVVTDEIGSPTYSLDLARAIAHLLGVTAGGTFHLTGDGTATRYEWAARIMQRCGRDRPLRPATRSEFVRASTPPAWGVLDGSGSVAVGAALRHWTAAFDEYAGTLCAGGGGSIVTDSAGAR